MFDSNAITNIKKIESIKIQMLENITDIFKGLELGNKNNIVIKNYLDKNIELTNSLIKILKINDEGDYNEDK